LGGGIIGELFGGQEELRDLPFAAEKARYAASLRETLAGEVGESQAILRREAMRSGTALGGAYLEGVSQLEQKRMEIFGRELSKYEIQQVAAQRAWQQQQAQVAYQAGVSRRQGIRELIGGAAGALAAYPMMKYQQGEQVKATERMEGFLEGMKPTVPATGQTDLYNRFLMAKMLAAETHDERWDLELRNLSKLMLGGASIFQTAEPTPVKMMEY